MRNLKECAGDIVLLEDACHALGSSEILSPEKSIKTGSCYYSHAAAFSSHAVKTIASGEGALSQLMTEILPKNFDCIEIMAWLEITMSQLLTLGTTKCIAWLQLPFNGYSVRSWTKPTIKA